LMADTLPIRKSLYLADNKTIRWPEIFKGVIGEKTGNRENQFRITMPGAVVF